MQAVNDTGEIVGTYTDNSGTDHGFLLAGCGNTSRAH